MFRRIITSLQQFTTEEGQGLVEYALILMLVAIVVLLILAVMGPSLGNLYSNIVNAI